MIVDCDLLIGRDVDDARRLHASELARLLDEHGIAGGSVASLRSFAFHAASGDDEAADAAAEHGWLPVAGIDLRDPLGAEQQIIALRGRGMRLVRFAPERQGIAPTAPRVRLLGTIAAAADAVILAEGALSAIAPALQGLGARVVFLDQHFYDVGEFIMLCRDEPGFHASTRLLGGPGAWEAIIEHVGAERLVFGARTGWWEVESVLQRLRAITLDEQDRALIEHGNLERLAAR